jgi:GxxExxY protein
LPQKTRKGTKKDKAGRFKEGKGKFFEKKSGNLSEFLLISEKKNEYSTLINSFLCFFVFFVAKGIPMRWENINQLCDIVRETSFAIHCFHKSGHLEKIYHKALYNRLLKQGIHVEWEYPILVYDEDGSLLGEFQADLFVENCLIVEVKAVRAVADEHVAQLLGYLRSSRIETGLLVNFGGPKLHVKKYLMTLRELPQETQETAKIA